MSNHGEFAWGAPDPTGLTIGLKLDPASSTGTFAYRIAVANRSTEPRQVVLFAVLDDRVRTRIVARQDGTEDARPAIVPAIPITANVRMVVDLAPGQVIERAGTPAQFKLAGDAVVHVVMGGVAGHPDEVRSGEVPVKLTPAS